MPTGLKPSDIKARYQKSGFALIKNVFHHGELAVLKAILQRFHQMWCADHAAFYEERAINSAYLTTSKHLDQQDRLTLFRFIAQDTLVTLAETLLETPAAFLNTQLFFDPANPAQKNYWHRDIQYSRLSLEDQKAKLLSDSGFHMRLALKPERGIELIPGTHLRWDTQREFDTRTSQNGRLPHHDLPESAALSLEAGDILIFSANMIHRGLYGQDRMAFDILYCTPTSEHLAQMPQDCMPDSALMQVLGNPPLYQRSLEGMRRFREAASSG